MATFKGECDHCGAEHEDSVLELPSYFHGDCEECGEEICNDCIAPGNETYHADCEFAEDEEEDEE